MRDILNKEDFEDCQKPITVEIGQELYLCYGADFAEITAGDIKALQDGKCLYFDINGGEYCLLLRLGETE